MKWLFLLLLVANAALFMWGRWYREPLVDPRPPAPPREVAQEKIKLLTEPGVRLMLRTRAQAPASVPVAAAARCYRLGPFAQAGQADAAGRQLAAAGFDFERVAARQTRPETWHVYLPPLPSREAAERRRQELTRLGFRDHALIQEPGLENGISLGVFEVESNARARLAQLARRGVQAQLRPVPVARVVYWLALEPPADSVARLEALAARDWAASDVALEPAPCTSAAPERPAD